MVIVHRIEWQELVLNVDHDVMQAHNKIHAHFRMQVEWELVGEKESGNISWKGWIQQN